MAAFRAAAAGYRRGDLEAAQPEYEACDDGNNVPGDGCDDRCQIESCGDEVVQLGKPVMMGIRWRAATCVSNCPTRSAATGSMASRRSVMMVTRVIGDDCVGNCRFARCGGDCLRRG